MFWRRAVRTKFDIYVFIIFKGNIPRRLYTIYYTFPVYMLQ